MIHLSDPTTTLIDRALLRMRLRRVWREVGARVERRNLTKHEQIARSITQHYLGRFEDAELEPMIRQDFIDALEAAYEEGRASRNHEIHTPRLKGGQ